MACSYRNGDKFVVHQITVIENIFNFNSVHRFNHVTGLKPYFLGNAARNHGFNFSRQMRHLRKKLLIVRFVGLLNDCKSKLLKLLFVNLVGRLHHKLAAVLNLGEGDNVTD